MAGREARTDRETPGGTGGPGGADGAGGAEGQGADTGWDEDERPEAGGGGCGAGTRAAGRRRICSRTPRRTGRPSVCRTLGHGSPAPAAPGPGPGPGMPMAGDWAEPGRPGLGLPAMRMPQMSQIWWHLHAAEHEKVLGAINCKNSRVYGLPDGYKFN